MAIIINKLNGGDIVITTGGSTPPTGHSDTRVTYVSGHIPESWSGEIIGNLNDESIPDMYQVETMDIGNTVSVIENYTFLDAEIKTIIIPETVTSIGYDAFKEVASTKIETTFTNRTKSQVQAMENYPWAYYKGIIHCTDGDLQVG